MGAIAYTLRQAGSVKANVKNLDQFNEVTHALTLIKADIKAALTVPTDREIVDNELTITRVNPALTFLDRTSESDGSDSPFAAEDQISVRYYVEEGVLRRGVTLPDNSVTSIPLLKVEHLTVERPTAQEIDVTLLTKNSRVEKARKIRVAILK